MRILIFQNFAYANFREIKPSWKFLNLQYIDLDMRNSEYGHEVPQSQTADKPVASENLNLLHVNNKGP